MALQVIGTKPKNSENNIYLDTEIEVQFNDALNVNTLNKSNFHLFDDAKAVDGKISYTPEDQKATFKPSQKLSPDQQYRMVLDSDIMSNDGNRLKSYTSTFRTVDSGYSLSRPVITHPSKDEKVGEPLIRWEPVYGANSYSLEVSSNINFNNPEYSGTVFHRNELRPTLKSNREYYLRMKANEVVDDGGETVEVKELYSYDELIYLGNNIFQIDISSEHTPLASLTSIRIYKTSDVNLSDHAERKDARVLSIAKSGFSDSSDTKIISEKRGVVQFNHPLEKGDTVEVIFEKYEKIVDSPWTDTIRFYYDKAQINFEELIELKTGEDKFLEISQQTQVDPGIDKIFFKLYYGHLTEDDVDVNLNGNHVNNLSSIDMGESHGRYYSDSVLKKDTKLIDWIQLTDNRFEYKIDKDKTPLLEMIKTGIGNKELQSSIVDKDRGIISVNEDLKEYVTLYIKKIFSEYFDDVSIVSNYYITPIFIEDEYCVFVDIDCYKDENSEIISKLPSKIMGVKVKYNYNVRPTLDGYTEEIRNYFDDINIISNYTHSPIAKERVEIKNVSPDVEIDTNSNHIIIAQVHYSDYSYGKYKSVQELSKELELKQVIDGIPVIYMLNLHYDIPEDVNNVYQFTTKTDVYDGVFTTKMYNELNMVESFTTKNYSNINEIKYEVPIEIEVKYSKLKVVETNKDYTVMRLIL